MVTNDFLMRAGIFIARIRENGTHSHALNLRAANLAKKAIDAYIEDEVNKAQNYPKTSPFYLSWEHIGQVLEISKSAAFARYGKKK